MVLEILNRVILSITYSTDSALEMLISLNDLPSAHKPVSLENFYRRGVHSLYRIFTFVPTERFRCCFSPIHMALSVITLDRPMFSTKKCFVLCVMWPMYWPFNSFGNLIGG